jgi:hypothetical protein
MSLVTALVAGGLIGVRHAFETDHVAAVATLVDDDSTEHPGLVGTSWGIGHSIPIAAFGLLFLLLGIEVPESITGLFELAVGIVLVYLGVRMIAEAADLGFVHHGHESGHSHLRVGGSLLGRSHHHVDGGGFLVGVLHGVAGSGALVVALVSAAPSLDAALAFLAAFSALSVVTMGAVSFAWGRALEVGGAHYLRGAAGVVGVAVGALLVFEQVLGLGLL